MASGSRFFSRTSITYILLILCVFLIQESRARARPPWLSPESGIFTESADCTTDDELLDLCQRCAKLTKSRLAYPACCSTDMKARQFCSDYVYFGRGSSQYEFYY